MLLIVIIYAVVIGVLTKIINKHINDSGLEFTKISRRNSGGTATRRCDRDGWNQMVIISMRIWVCVAAVMLGVLACAFDLDKIMKAGFLNSFVKQKAVT